MRRLFLAALLSLVATPRPSLAAGPVEFREGDRVVFLGDTFVERDASYGYFETLLVSRLPGLNLQFRNLGWSGDTVWGDARAGFGTREDGFRQLKTHVTALKPTVLLVSYGRNESFAGEAGLAAFEAGLKTLLDTLAETKARIVLLTPMIQEDLGRPLPDPSASNKRIAMYAETVRKIARERGLGLIDLHAAIGDGTKGPGHRGYTDDGLHFTAYGSWQVAAALETGLGLPARFWAVTLGSGGPVVSGTSISDVASSPSGAKFRLKDETLADCPAPPKTPPVAIPTDRVLKVSGLTSGRYVLKIDGQAVATASADDWARGVNLTTGPDREQAEKLRATINAKNELYFYRWRPQNETYLFGFRKHEQGNNAREVPEFDPLVAAKESEIAGLKKPVERQYELIREEGSK